MAKYLVQWEIDVETDNPIRAAREALKQMKESDSQANCFKVINKDTNESCHIDLQEEGCKDLEPGTQVWWNDPEDETSGYYYFQTQEGEIITITQYKDGSGSLVECYFNELHVMEID